VNDPARSFERAAEEYEQGRPGYPVDVLDLIELPAAATVLDLAAGTGKLTRILVERYARVVAVEPLDAMRAVLECEVPGADARAGSAEAIPAADDEFDAVFVAQAFHWFATEAAAAELVRVLRPGGFLMLIWNTLATAPVTPPLPDPFRQRVRELREEAEAGRGGLDWRATLAQGPFEELRESVVPHEAVLDAEAMLAQVASFSWVAKRPEAERRCLLAELRAQLPGTTYTMSLDAEVYWTRLERCS
jgi:SAM-dependent methyltransferase